MYAASTFILPYISTDKRIQLQDIALNRVGGFSVCHFQKAMTEGKEVWINLRDLRIVLAFQSSNDAKVALANLEAAITSLLTNCNLGGGGSTINAYQTSFTTTAGVPLTITHNLGSLDFIYHAREGNDDISLDLARINANQVTITTTVGITGSIIFTAI